MNIDKILVATDFSPSADAALAYALDLAAAIGRRVVVLHVSGPLALPVLDGAIIPTASELTEQLTRANERLAALSRRFERAGVTLETRAVQGAAAEEIVRFAQAEACDLIVMGTHGRTGFMRVALGSVAERVVRMATVPVLTIRAKPDALQSFFESPPLL